MAEVLRRLDAQMELPSLLVDLWMRTISSKYSSVVILFVLECRRIYYYHSVRARARARLTFIRAVVLKGL